MSTKSSAPAAANLYPKWFTQSQWQRLLRNDTHDDTFGRKPVVKLFTPDGSATWLLISVSQDEPDLAFGLCDLGVGFPELGYVSLSELAALRGALNLPVEKDRHVKLDKPLRVYVAQAEQSQHIMI